MNNRKKPVHFNWMFECLTVIPTNEEDLHEFCELWDHLERDQILRYCAIDKIGWVRSSDYALDWLHEVEFGFVEVDESVTWYDDLGRRYYEDIFDNVISGKLKDKHDKEMLNNFYPRLSNVVDFEKLGKQIFDSCLNVFDPDVNGMITIRKPVVALEREWNGE